MNGEAQIDRDVDQIRREYIDSPGVPAFAEPDRVTSAAQKIVSMYRQTSPSDSIAARLITSILEEKKITETEFVNGVLPILERQGVGPNFFLAAGHPYDDTLAKWLASKNIGWETIYQNCEFRVKDAISFKAGFLSGVVKSVVDITELVKLILSAPEIQQKIDIFLWSTVLRILIEGPEEVAKGHARVIVDLVTRIAPQQYVAWRAELNEKFYRRRYFEAGAQIGEAVGIIAQLIEAGIGLARVAPKLVRAAAPILREGLATTAELARAGVAAGTDIAKTLLAELKVLGRVGFAKLPKLATPRIFLMIQWQELETLIASGAKSFTSQFGYSFIRFDVRVTEEAALATGPELGWVSGYTKEPMYMVRDPEGKIVGTITNREWGQWQRSMRREFEKGCKSVDESIPTNKADVQRVAEKLERQVLLSKEALEVLLTSARERAANSKSVKEFLGYPTNKTLTVSIIENEIALTLPDEKKRRLFAIFGTAVHEAIQPDIAALAKTKGFGAVQNKSLYTILSNTRRSEDLDLTVLQYCNKYGLELSPEAAKSFGGTVVGDMRPDLVILDTFGLPVGYYDWTSLSRLLLEKAANKTLPSISQAKLIHLEKSFFQTQVLGMQTNLMQQGGDVYYTLLELWKGQK